MSDTDGAGGPGGGRRGEGHGARPRRLPLPSLPSGGRRGAGLGSLRGWGARRCHGSLINDNLSPRGGKAVCE